MQSVLRKVPQMRYIFVFILALGGCAEFPALDGTISDAARDAPYPTLGPLPDDLLQTTQDDSALTAQIAALNARADLLRQIDMAALQ